MMMKMIGEEGGLLWGKSGPLKPHRKCPFRSLASSYYRCSALQIAAIIFPYDLIRWTKVSPSAQSLFHLSTRPRYHLRNPQQSQRSPRTQSHC